MIFDWIHAHHYYPHLKKLFLVAVVAVAVVVVVVVVVVVDSNFVQPLILHICDYMTFEAINIT